MSTSSRKGDAGGIPEQRYASAAAAIGHRIYLFGTDLLVLSSMYAATITTQGSRTHHDAYDTTSIPCVPLTAGGFGGGLHRTLYNDVRVLDTRTMIWSTLQTSGPKPTKRFGHTLDAVGSQLYVYGKFQYCVAGRGRGDAACETMSGVLSVKRAKLHLGWWT